MTSIRQILLTGVALFSAAILPAQELKPPQAHFHHVHLNVTNPKAAADFYTTKFDAEKARFAGVMDAVRTQKSWLLFTKVDSPPPSEIVSTIWHIGWGAEDMPATYKQQLESGTKFETPLTDISALAGLSPGRFYYAYVDGPEHALIELNTASHHRFGHLHLLSEDPVAAAEWYQKHLGIPVRGKSAKERIYEGYPVGPSASLQADNVNIIIFPVGYAHKAWPTLWDGRKSFESTKGRAIDHIGFSVDHLQDWLERLRADGVKVTAEPRTVADGKIKFAFVEGPDHILIELVEGSPDQQ